MNPEIISVIGSGESVELSRTHNEELVKLNDHLIENIKLRLDDAKSVGDEIYVMDADWCRENSEQAGKLHADIIIEAYGPTYALPNKDPDANTAAIEKGELDLYLMKTNGVLTGTACMVDAGDGRAELGRAASLGRARNTIIQDLRLVNWLNNDETADRFHTLFATLRSAPDRPVALDDGSEFTMRGGQAVTEHWKKFPGLRVYGIAPLYLKANKLEQFSYVAVARTVMRNEVELFIQDDDHKEFVTEWHHEYGLSLPRWRSKSDDSANESSEMAYEVHYPPQITGLTEYVHADIVKATEPKTPKTMETCVEEAVTVGSPFIQVEVPVESDTLPMQTDLIENGFKLYGYKPPTDLEEASLLFGRLRTGVSVVPTAWDSQDVPNPIWDGKLGKISRTISRSW